MKKGRSEKALKKKKSGSDSWGIQGDWRVPSAAQRLREKVKEREIRMLERLCCVLALCTAALCILFLAGILQNFWVLNFALLFGILMNLAMAVLFVLRRKPVMFAVSLVFFLALTAGLIYFHCADSLTEALAGILEYQA